MTARSIEPAAQTSDSTPDGVPARDRPMYILTWSSPGYTRQLGLGREPVNSRDETAK